MLSVLRVSGSQGLMDSGSQHLRVSGFSVSGSSQGISPPSEVSRAFYKIPGAPRQKSLGHFTKSQVTPVKLRQVDVIAGGTQPQAPSSGQADFLFYICFCIFSSFFFVRLCPRQKYGDISVYAGKVACSEIVPPSEVSPPSEVWRPIYKKIKKIN